jgi:drug/metabolite transporter (DMT)-like permease
VSAARSSAFKPRAVLWLLGAITSFATMDTAAKWLSQSYPLIAAVWVRYLLPTVFLGVYLFAKKGFGFAHAPQPAVQIARGVALVASTVCFWTALKNLPLVEAAVVSFVCPTIVVVLSSLLLKERPARAHWVALALGFAGVVIALRPGVSHAGIGAIAALASAALYAVYIVLTRKVANEADATTLLFHANALGALLLTFAAPAVARMPTGFEWVLLPLLGMLGLGGHWCMIKAYEMATATALAPFMYLQLLIATFYGWLVFSNLPDGFTLVGMAFILLGGFIAMRHEHRSQAIAAQPAAATAVAATPE